MKASPPPWYLDADTVSLLHETTACEPQQLAQV
jgi:hypothetical protein